MAPVPRPLSPEFAVLAACTLLDDDRLAELAPPLVRRPGFDWDRFVDLGVFHGVEQVARARLERTMPGAPPAVLEAGAAAGLMQNAAFHAPHARFSLKVVPALERAGIPALVLKGAALAGQLYATTPEARVSSDNDVLVRPDRLDAADTVLREAGQTPQLTASGSAGGRVGDVLLARHRVRVSRPRVRRDDRGPLPGDTQSPRPAGVVRGTRGHIGRG